MPEVSVIVPAFNAASTIGSAVASIQAQTYRDFEIIIVDDGSKDGTADAAERAAPEAIVVRRSNGGPGAARNSGIERARGRLIAFLDADDLWLPDKLAMQVPYFDKYPNTGLLHAPLLIFPAADPLEPPQKNVDELRPPEQRFCELFHIDIIINTLTVLVPREILVEVGGFDERREIHVEDWDLWLRIAARHPVGFQPRAVGLHRLGGLMSTAFEKTYAGQRVVIGKNQSLCAAACDRHRGNPSACLSRRLHSLNDELGREYVRRGDLANARRAFREAIRHRPLSLASGIRLAACAAGSRYLLEYLHAAKSSASRRLRRKTDEPDIHVSREDALVVSGADDRDKLKNRLDAARSKPAAEMMIDYPRVFERQADDLLQLLATLARAGFRYNAGVSPVKTRSTGELEGLTIRAFRPDTSEVKRS